MKLKRQNEEPQYLNNFMKHLKFDQKLEQLRIKAQTQLEDTECASQQSADYDKLVHELHIHQIELEMQNDELLRTQDKLETACAHYSELYDFAPVGYLNLNADGFVIDLNFTAARLLDVECQHPVNRRLEEFVADQYKDLWYCRFVEAKQQKKAVFELPFQHRNGKPKFFRVDYQYIEQNNKPPVMHLTLADITELKQAKQELNDAGNRKSEFLAMLGHELRNPLTPISTTAQLLCSQILDQSKLNRASQLLKRNVSHITFMGYPDKCG